MNTILSPQTRPHRDRISRILAVMAATALVVTGCGSSGSATTAASAPTTTSDAAAVASWQAKATAAIPDAAFRKSCVTVKGAEALSTVVPACS